MSRAEKHLAIVFALVLLAFAAGLILEVPTVDAQNNGNTGTQTVSKRVFTNQTTAAISTVVIPNIGASSHWFTVCQTNAVTISAQLEASNNATSNTTGTWFPISHNSTAVTPACIVLQAGGYFQSIRANILTLTGGGTQVVNAWYTGSTGPIPGNFIGDAIQVQGTPTLQVASAPENVGPDFTQNTGTAATVGISLTAPDTAHVPAIHHISAFCSAGTAVLHVCQGTSPCGAVLYSAPVGTTPLILDFSMPLVPAPGNGIAAELTTCGGGNVGTLNVVSTRVMTGNP